VDGTASTPHLHLEMREFGTYMKSHKNYPYFRHVADWRYGSNLNSLEGLVIQSILFSKLYSCSDLFAINLENEKLELTDSQAKEGVGNARGMYARDKHNNDSNNWSGL
jgi:hypothetical protein